MNTLVKSSAIEFPAFDDLDSSDESGDLAGEGHFSEDTSIWQKPQILEKIVDLSTMFKTQPNLSKLPPKLTDAVKLSILDYEYNLDNFSRERSEQRHVEPIECVVINLAHLEQFPRAASPYSANNLPLIYTWFDAHTAFSSEFPTMVQNYFKTVYNCIRTHLRFFFSIAPSYERLNNLSSVRREVPSGRILFHYIGYGFPDIDSNNIWCSDRRSRDFIPFRLDLLFEKVQPPTWYIFDCNNAEAAIEKFAQAADKLTNGSRNQDCLYWNDWLCICATSKGENLPDDPRLPRDFLTSTVLTPIKMAVICHILQFYRINLVNKSFPIDPPCSHLWEEKSKDSTKLTLALTALTDGIAAGSLPIDLYQQIFRRDRLSASLYRHFLLAQFLLRPYRVHPVAHPMIPDLSLNDLWRQWSILLDTAICAVSIPRKRLMQLSSVDMFTRAATSFDVLLKNGQFSLVKPFHLTFLFHSLFGDPSNDQPLMLLSEYASDSRSNPTMLVSSTIFPPLFSRILTKSAKSAVFQPLCRLILTLLYHNPDFSNDIQKDLDVSNFPNLVFTQDLPIKTRITVAALVANLVVSHEKFQQICTSPSFLEKVKIELTKSQPMLTIWLLLIIRRSFNLYSPDPAIFTDNGLHLQVSVCAMCESPVERAAAVSALTCFMRPFECKCNVQLLLMALSTACDASFLVRFHLVLLLKKFVMTFDNFADVSLQKVEELQIESYKDLMFFIYGPKYEKNAHYEIIDQIVREDNCLEKAYSITIFLLKMFSNDPHPSVSSLAHTILNFISKSKADLCEMETDDELNQQNHQLLQNRNYPNSKNISAEMDQFVVTYGDEEFEADHLSFANLDQNESLNIIMLRFLVISEQKNDYNVINECQFSETNFKISDGPLLFVDFDCQSGMITAASKFCVYFLDSNNVDKNIAKNKEKILLIDFSDTYVQIIDLRLVKNDTNLLHVLIAFSNGCVGIWIPPNKTLENIFLADLRKSINLTHSFVFENEKKIITLISDNGNISKWDKETLLLQSETKTKIDVIAAVVENSSLILVDKENIYEFDDKMLNVSTIAHKSTVCQIFVKHGIKYLVSKNGTVLKFYNGKCEEIFSPNKIGHTLCCSFSDNNILLCLENENPMLLNVESKTIIINDNGVKGINTCAIHDDEQWCVFGDVEGSLFINHLNISTK